MADTTTKGSSSKRAGDKDFVARLTEAGEEALQRIVELPGGQRAVGAFNDLKARVDDLGKRVRGIEQLEERVAKLERDVTSLKKRGTPARRAAPRKPPS